jgi:hypothetical protein
MNIIVYPKGFLGFDIGLPVKDRGNDLDQLIGAIKLNLPPPKETSGVSNHDVEVLWKSYIGGFSYMTSFEFREKVLLAALRAFGTSDFREWLVLQEKSPYYTEMHRRFINDTLHFILNGKRSVVVQSWSVLIRPTEVSHRDRETVVNVDGFFRHENQRSEEFYAGDGERPGTELTNVLHQWTSRPNGFEDLLETLHILFGHP